MHFQLDADDVAALRSGTAALAVTHDRYRHETQLDDDTITELLDDLEN